MLVLSEWTQKYACFRSAVLNLSSLVAWRGGGGNDCVSAGSHAHVCNSIYRSGMHMLFVQMELHTQASTAHASGAVCKHEYLPFVQVELHMHDSRPQPGT